MTFPHPLAAVLASLMATADVPMANTVDTQPFVLSQDKHGNRLPVPLVMSTLGPHRFRFPQNLYDGQIGPYRMGEATMLSVQWPSLEPLPMGVDYHDATETFISEITIDIWHLEELSDDAYRHRLSGFIEASDRNSLRQSSHPSWNLGLRIKASPVHGLVPYLVDFDKLKTYYLRMDGSAYPAADPSGHPDWFLHMDRQGNPLSVIKCSSRLLPDGMRLVNGKVIDMVDEEGTRASCDHHFLMSEYKIIVSMRYPRIALFDWKRIEERVKHLMKISEIR